MDPAYIRTEPRQNATKNTKSIHNGKPNQKRSQKFCCFLPEKMLLYS